MSSGDNFSVTEQQKKEAEFLDAVLKKFRAMDEEDQHQSFVDAGIVNQDGELTTTYGGTADPEES
jgi:hypothetical protein